MKRVKGRLQTVKTSYEADLAALVVIIFQLIGDRFPSEIAAISGRRRRAS
jgi:hypothetical protein